MLLGLDAGELSVLLLAQKFSPIGLSLMNVWRGELHRQFETGQGIDACAAAR
jgi:hypothetical protein